MDKNGHVKLVFHPGRTLWCFDVLIFIFEIQGDKHTTADGVPTDDSSLSMPAGHTHTHTQERHSHTEHICLCNGEANAPGRDDIDTDSRGPEMRHDGTWQSDMECLAAVGPEAAQSSASS